MVRARRSRVAAPATPTAIGAPVLAWVVLLVLPVRFLASVFAQAVTALVLWLGGSDAPWMEAAGWWTVYGTLTDVLCLLALVWALRVEGLRLRDLFALGSGGIGAQLRAIPLYLLFLVPFVAGSALVAMSFTSGAAPGQIAVIDLPV